MPVPASRSLFRSAVGVQLLVLLTAVGGLSACMGDDDRTSPSPAAREAPVVEDAGPIHVHALGVNPKDGALFIATHTGLFRASGEGEKPKRVADRWQDTMGFTVTGSDRFLGSGHPDGREDLPPFLGLIESTDAGRTWQEVSLQGTMDFHVLEAAENRIYGFGSEWDTKAQRLLVSNDGGDTWWRRKAPEPLIDLAIAPGDADTAVLAGSRGLHITRDAAQSWRELTGAPGLLMWLGRQLIAVDRRGVVRAAADGLRHWQVRGQVDGEPAALAAGPGRALYVALHDGTIRHSEDGGVSWSVWGSGAEAREERATRQGSEDAPEGVPNRSHEALRDVPGAPSEE